MALKDLQNDFFHRLDKRIQRLGAGKPSFEGRAPEASFSDEDLDVFRKIRGKDYPPAIILHGVTTRSGSVYATEVLRLHPETFAFPKDIWEFPLLQTLDQMLPQQEHFFRAYRQNEGKIHDHLLLPLLGASIIHYLYAFVPEGKTLLLKIPNAAYLDYFPIMFPFEKCVVLMRDGRDIVQSTVATWKNRSFTGICEDWDKRARFLLQLRERFADSDQFYFTSYEAVQEDADTYARNVFEHFGMPVHTYPFGETESLPVRGSSSASVGQDHSVTWDPVEKPKNFKARAKWRDQWSGKQKAQFKKIAGETLIRWGYAENMDW